MACFHEYTYKLAQQKPNIDFNMIFDFLQTNSIKIRSSYLAIFELYLKMIQCVRNIQIRYNKFWHCLMLECILVSLKSFEQETF